MEAVEGIVKIGEKEGLKIGDLKMKDKIVCIVGLGYVKLFCKQKPLLKKMLTLFLLRKTNISLVKLSFKKKGLLM